MPCVAPGRRRIAFVAMQMCVVWSLSLASSAQPEPGATPLPPAEGEAALAQPRVTAAMAADAWQEERWADAANYYRVLCRDFPDDALFHYRLAYALHADGQFRRAVAAHQRSAEFGPYRAVSLYNLGCAHAALGNADRAFESLRAALEAGFADREQMIRDEDLYPLHDDPRWEGLVRSGGRPPAGGPRGPAEERPGRGDVDRDLAFLLGDWEVRDERGRRVGTAGMHAEHDGRTLVRQWSGDDGTTGTALLFYDGVHRAWRQVGIDSEGVAVEMTGRAGRDELHLEGELHTRRGERTLQRSTIALGRDGNLEQTARESEDGGRTWRTVRISSYRRLGIVPPVARPDPRPRSPGGPARGWKPGLARDKGL